REEEELRANTEQERSEIGVQQHACDDRCRHGADARAGEPLPYRHEPGSPNNEIKPRRLSSAERRAEPTNPTIERLAVYRNRRAVSRCLLPKWGSAKLAA